MLGLLKRDQPVLDEDSIAWLFDSFGWALQHLDHRVFIDETQLITPSNEHFPGKANSIQGIANLIFNQVANHAGMGHWPYRLMDQNSWTGGDSPTVVIEGALRGAQSQAPAQTPSKHQLNITYDANQINNPEAMIATFAHTLAHYLASTATEPPPGGEENWPQTTEVVAVFLGFGIMFSNSAYSFRAGGCGSCQGAAADRSNSLSQYDITYALAIFSQLKDIPTKQVTPHLKKSLRGYYKQCVKDLVKRTAELATLRSHLIDDSVE